MTRSNAITTLCALLLLCACPIEAAEPPKDDAGAPASGESGQATDPASTTDPATGGSTETGAGETGSEPLTCEDQLAKVKADLAACLAAGN